MNVDGEIIVKCREREYVFNFPDEYIGEMLEEVSSLVKFFKKAKEYEEKNRKI